MSAPRPEILFVHGLWMHGCVFALHRRRLRAMGWRSHAYSYPSLRGSLAGAADGLAAIERIVGAGPWIAGDRFSLADILLFSFIEFGAMVGQPLDAALANLVAWRDRVAARPSAADSANHKQGVAEPA